MVVDVISGLGADEFKQDEWSVDVAVGGSQKGLMIPPGLSFCSVSKKAWGEIEKSKSTKFYLDFKKYKKSADKDDVPFTPAITLMVALKKALETIKEKGIDNTLLSCKEMGEYLKSKLEPLGLTLFSK